MLLLNPSEKLRQWVELSGPIAEKGGAVLAASTRRVAAEWAVASRHCDALWQRWWSTPTAWS